MITKGLYNHHSYGHVAHWAIFEFLDNIDLFPVYNSVCNVLRTGYPKLV